MYKMPFKSDNPSLCMILTQRNYQLWRKNEKICKNDNFSTCLTYTPHTTGNGYLMAIEARNMYKMPFKSDNPLPDMILSQKTRTYRQKMYKITNFHCF